LGEASAASLTFPTENPQLVADESSAVADVADAPQHFRNVATQHGQIGDHSANSHGSRINCRDPSP
jgi:hypothetical protein